MLMGARHHHPRGLGRGAQARSPARPAEAYLGQVTGGVIPTPGVPLHRARRELRLAERLPHRLARAPWAPYAPVM